MQYNSGAMIHLEAWIEVDLSITKVKLDCVKSAIPLITLVVAPISGFNKSGDFSQNSISGFH